MSLKIGLIGFGRTGFIVAKEIVQDSALSLEWVCKRTHPKEISFASQALGHSDSFAPFVTIDNLNKSFIKNHPVDVVIDFSSAEMAPNYKVLASAGIKIVSAISNYSTQEIDLLKQFSKSTSVLYSPNITLGINWLIMASKMLRKIIPHADVEVIEEHFREKKDISGTALKLAQQLDIDPVHHVNSIRVGGIVGKHEVIFGLPHQTVRLVHESISRSAFGTGAIFAAKWLSSQSAGLYSMENALEETFSSNISKLKLA